MTTIIQSSEWDRVADQVIDDLLDQHALENGTPFDPVPLHLKAIDDEGRFLGGLSGILQFDWLFIKLFALSPEARQSGLGTRLMHRAEMVARDADKKGIYLDTFTFQAPDFYRKLGFEEVGRLPMIGDFPQRIWFCKVF